GLDRHRVERELEDARVGFGDTDGAGVDDAVDLDTDSRADLKQLRLGETLSDHAVGVRHDAEPYPGGCQLVQPVATTGQLAHPQRRVGELTVEMQVHVLAEVLRDAARSNELLEVHVPAFGPFALVVPRRKRPRTRVVRAIEDRRVGSTPCPIEGTEDAVVRRDEEHAAHVEQHGLRAVGKGNRHAGKTTEPPEPGWYR